MKPTAPTDTLPARPAERHHRPAPKREREAFEQCLEQREGHPDVVGSMPLAEPVRPPALEENGAPAVERTDLPRTSPLAAAPIDPLPSAVAQGPDPSQAAWAQRLTTPAVVPGHAQRFEVIDPAAPRGVSSIEVQALGAGVTTVAVVTGAEHAALLDRHLPQLQRRLASRGVSHVRVDARDDPLR